MDKVTFKQGTPSDEQLETYTGKLIVIDNLTRNRGHFKQFVQDICAPS